MVGWRVTEDGVDEADGQIETPLDDGGTSGCGSEAERVKGYRKSVENKLVAADCCNEIDGEETGCEEVTAEANNEVRWDWSRVGTVEKCVVELRWDEAGIEGL